MELFLVDETISEFGYSPLTLRRWSQKPVRVRCPRCLKSKTTKRWLVHADWFCATCSARNKMSALVTLKRLPEGVRGFNRLYGQYQRNAKKHHREFSLTEDAFKQLVSGDCYYCGLPPSQWIEGFLYSGVDRTDNALGYIPQNCVPCCRICNRAKGRLGKAEFAAWIKRLRENGTK